MSQAEFARRAGLSPQLINDVIRGRSYLGRKSSRRVVEVTGGEVTLEDLVGWDPERSMAAS